MGPVPGPTGRVPSPYCSRENNVPGGPGAFQGLIGETKCKQGPDAGAGGGSGTQGLAAPTAGLSSAWPHTLRLPQAGMQKG